MPLPISPSNLSELLADLPVPYEYGRQYLLVFSEELKNRLVQVQAEHPNPLYAKPLLLTDGRWSLPGEILSEVPNGLYGVGFQNLDSSRFNEIEVITRESAASLLPQVDPSIFESTPEPPL
jgi:hypothetical protein